MGSNPKLSIITFNVSDEIMDMIVLGIARGWWCSKSEGLRIACGRGLAGILKEREAINQKVVENLQFQGGLDPTKEYAKVPGRGYVEIIGEA